MSLLRLLLIAWMILFSNQSLACGTADNWMDAYQGVRGVSEWRNRMNQLESLVMLKSCGGPKWLKKSQQLRMKSILIDAYLRRAELIKLQAMNRDIRSKVMTYRRTNSFEGLLKAIYKRFKCLPEANEQALKGVASNELQSAEFFLLNMCT